MMCRKLVFLALAFCSVFSLLSQESDPTPMSLSDQLREIATEQRRLNEDSRTDLNELSLFMQDTETRLGQLVPQLSALESDLSNQTRSLENSRKWQTFWRRATIVSVSLALLEGIAIGVIVALK